MPVEVYLEELIEKAIGQAEKKELVDAFKQYKTPSPFNFGSQYFGKDEGLTQPPQVRGILYKTHMQPQTAKDRRLWNKQINTGATPASDHILVYTCGQRKNDAFLLLDILRPDGHKKMKNFPHLLNLLAIARQFREEF